jgi:monomeric isocitrate dehydrogenase
MGTSVMSAESEESMIEPKAVQQCKDIVRATTWEGDIRVNITTIIGAGRILAKRVDELEEAPRRRTFVHDANQNQENLPRPELQRNMSTFHRPPAIAAHIWQRRSHAAATSPP